jgi:hypothetical protein
VVLGLLQQLTRQINSNHTLACHSATASCVAAQAQSSSLVTPSMLVFGQWRFHPQAGGEQEESRRKNSWRTENSCPTHRQPRYKYTQELIGTPPTRIGTPLLNRSSVNYLDPFTQFYYYIFAHYNRSIQAY